MINLKKTYGKKYRVTYEKYMDGSVISYHPQYMQLKSSRGHVYVHSDTHLGFATKSRMRVFNDIPEMELTQNGDDGQNYVFKVEHLKKLAKVLKLYRRKKISPEQRSILVERLARMRETKDSQKIALKTA